MRIYTCNHCQSRNTHGGRCVECFKSLGSPVKALVAALASGVIMALLWIGISWFTGLQLPFIAMIFGGLISLAVTMYSGGVGLLYQGIATLATTASILVADTVVVLLLLEDKYAGTGWSAPPLSISLLEQQALYDPYSFLFVTIGIMGGLYIWTDMAGSR